MSPYRTSLLGGLALAASMLGACDPPEYVVTPPDGGETVADAGAEGGFDYATCVACIQNPDTPGPGCGTAYEACQANTKCANMMNCSFQSGCLGGASAQFIMCSLPCVEEAGALSPSDPGLALATPLFECIANGACQPVCLSK